ncbi:MAG: HAD family hydrolase [Alphaproteobacteria bacterium]
MPQRLAIFDFDGTLVLGDSLPRFIAACAGWPVTIAAALWAALASVTATDRRTAFKTLWLRLCLKNFPVDKIEAACARLDQELRWNANIRARLRWHSDRGDIIAVASGGLDLYLPHILRAEVVTHLLCTRMAVSDGRLTGAMMDGNCVRQEKARRIAELIAALGPCDEIWAYGNLPHDLPMMELATHRVIV